MLFRGALLLGAGCALAQVGCMSSGTRRTLTSAETVAHARVPVTSADTRSEVDRKTRTPPDDAALARPIDLPTVQAAVLARNPGLVEAERRVRAVTARARAEGSLPPPELGMQLWMVPLARPYAVQDAGMLMLSLTQEIPPAGSLDLTAQATALEARAGAVMVAGRARMILRETDRAFADYVEATARHAAHVEHLALVEQMTAAARARYSVGGPLSDFTKAELERARMRADIARELGSIEEARAMLNGLLARPVDAPLGPPTVEEAATVRASTKQLAERAVANHPDVAAASLMREAARSMADATDREATVPKFMVGLSYFHPVGETEAGWGASLGMSLPWLWGAASRRAESAEQSALAEEAAADVARTRVRADVAKAMATVRAAEARLTVLRDSARPSARRALDAMVAGYAAGGTDILMWLDAERASLDVAVEMVMARGDLDRALADLDWAVGQRVARASIADSSASPASGGRP